MILFVQPDEIEKGRELAARPLAYSRDNKATTKRQGDARAPTDPSAEAIKASAAGGKR